MMNRRFLYGGLFLAAGTALQAVEPSKPRPVAGLRIARETTVILGPLNEVGSPDYVAALDEKLSRGVAPEENFWSAYCETLPRNVAGDRFFEKLATVPGFGRTCSLPTESYSPAGTDIEAANKQLETSMNRPWKPDDLPIIARWLDRNREPLARVTEAARRPKAYAPLITGNGTTMAHVLLPHVQQTRDSARAFSARAFLALGEGRGDDAWKDVLTLHRLARHNQQSPFLIGYLVGIAISSIARIPTEACLVDPAASTEVLAARWRELSTEMGPESRTTPWLIGERFCTLDLTLAIRSGLADADELLNPIAMLGAPGASYQGREEDLIPIDFSKAHRALQSMMLKAGDVNKTLAFSNEYHDRIAEALAVPEYLARKAAIEEVVHDYLEGRSADDLGSVAAAFFLGGPDAVENIAHASFIRHFSAAFGQCVKAEARMIARNRLLHAAFAAEIHYRTTGSDVVDVEQLREAIQKSAAIAGVDLLPMKDPYSGEFFRIVQEPGRFVVYAIGDNGKSDGGKSFGEGEGCDDIVVVLKRGTAPAGQ